MRRGSLRKLSSHSATTGMITSSLPIAGCSSMSSSHAASYTLPTCMVEVRKTGVSASPSSRMASSPVHSPTPLSTAAPAGTGAVNRSPPGSSTLTPVRAMPRPAGGGGSSRQTVAWPSPAPGTSSTEPVGPDGSRPMVMPRSVTRGIPRW